MNNYQYICERIGERLNIKPWVIEHLGYLLLTVGGIALLVYGKNNNYF